MVLTNSHSKIGRAMGAAMVLAVAYPLVWVGAGLIGFVAGVTSDVQTDTTGLGDAIAGFLIGSVLLNLAWAVVAFLVLRRFGRSVRSMVAAIGTPATVIAALVQSLPLGVALAALLPWTASRWAAAPKPVSAPIGRRSAER